MFEGVREKGNIMSTYLFFFSLLSLFPNILNYFVNFTDMNYVVLVEYCS